MMQSPLANISPVVKNLLIINVICFLPYLLFPHGAGEMDYSIKKFGVYYIGSPHFRPWQLITHMFLHGGWMHIIFNMFALYSFGNTIEYVLGSKRFLAFYFICGIGAVALQLLVQSIEVYHITGQFTLASPELDSSYLQYGEKDGLKLYSIFNFPMVGASGAISGVLIAFALIYPNAELLIMFIPVPVKAKYVMPGYILLSIFLGVAQVAGDDVAHFAHLGGAVLGFILVKMWRLQGPRGFY